MNLAVLIPFYVYWYCCRAPRALLTIAGDCIEFLWRYFSLDIVSQWPTDPGGLLVSLVYGVLGVLIILFFIIVAACIFILWFMLPFIMIMCTIIGVIFLIRS